MQLYKSRGFSAFFQDTFSFIKQNGKHYFKHFFIVNGIFLLILMAIGYFITKFYSDFLFSGVLQGGNSNTVFDEYMNENFGFFILFSQDLLFILTLTLIISILLIRCYNFSYQWMPHNILMIKIYN